MNDPKIQVTNTPEYRETYANSVQVRVNLWDFFLMFGTLVQNTPDAVNIQNFQGIYLSPQQAKALLNIMQQNVSQYEATFGEIRLEPQNPGQQGHYPVAHNDVGLASAPNDRFAHVLLLPVLCSAAGAALAGSYSSVFLG